MRYFKREDRVYIQVSKDVRAKLNSMKEYKDSYETVLRKILGLPKIRLIGERTEETWKQ
jgi:predicted CopG family antitoxin